MNRIIKTVLSVWAGLMGLASCSVYKYVPEGEYLLDKIEVTLPSKSDRTVKKSDLAPD